MGEVGCTLSHIRLWRELAATQQCDQSSFLAVEDYAKASAMLVLEDDAVFHPNFISGFYQLWSNIPKD